VRRFWACENTLTDAEHNHLANVLRLKVGDTIIAVRGDEFDYFFQIAAITKKETKLKFLEKQKNQHNPQKSFTVYLGAIKFDNLALAVTQLNEIGVTDIVIFRSERCQNVPVNIEKLQKIAEQSCKQCGRSIPVRVKECKFEEIPSGGIFADEKCTSLRGVHDEAISIIIGPEGGFTEREREELKQKATPVSLGGRILRAETAAVVGAAILLHAFG